MITITPLAQEQVKSYFADKTIQPVRIFISNGGCGGPQLAMALDEVKPEDTVVTVDGVEYIMEKSLLEQANPVKVDFNGVGFSIDSSLDLGGGCSSCGSGGSCCS